MFKKNATLSYSTQVMIEYTISGTLWCLACIFGFFDTLPCQIIHIILLFASILALLFPFTRKRELSDEMSDSSMDKARSFTLLFFRVFALVIIISIDLGLFSILPVLNWKRVIKNLLILGIGLQDITVGLLYKHYEEV